jgi:uncharacterized membrane-anchored protein
MCDVNVLWSCFYFLSVYVSNMGNPGRRRMSWTMFPLNSKSVQFYSCLLLFLMVLMAFLPTSLEQDEDIPHNE